MTVTVCATHQAQNDFRGVRSAAKCGEVRIAPPVLFQVDVLVPISPVKGNLQARRRQSANVRKSIRIGPSCKQDIGDITRMRTVAIGKVDIRRISKGKVVYSLAVVVSQVLQIRPARREYMIVLG